VSGWVAGNHTDLQHHNGPTGHDGQPSHGTVASPNGLSQNNAALRIVPFGSGSSKFAIFFSTSSSSSVYEYLFTTNGSNTVYSTNTTGVLYGFKVFNKPDGSAAFVYNPTTSGTAVNNYGPDKTTVSTGYATVGTNTNYGYTFRAADGTLLARIPTNTDWSYFSSAVVPSVAGVAKAAANSGDVVGIARTGTYRLNKSYGTFVFNNKGSSPPGAKALSLVPRPSSTLQKPTSIEVTHGYRNFDCERQHQRHVHLHP